MGDELVKFDDIWNCESAGDWLFQNVDEDMVLDPVNGITVKMLVERLEEAATSRLRCEGLR